MKVNKIRDNVSGFCFSRHRSAFSKGDATVNTSIFLSMAHPISSGCFGLLNRNSLRFFILSKLVPDHTAVLLPEPLLFYSNRFRNYPLFLSLMFY
jgi:hypothetical protein